MVKIRTAATCKIVWYIAPLCFGSTHGNALRTGLY